jgi:hypothetical protein
MMHGQKTIKPLNKPVCVQAHDACNLLLQELFLSNNHTDLCPTFKFNIFLITQLFYTINCVKHASF